VLDIHLVTHAFFSTLSGSSNSVIKVWNTESETPISLWRNDPRFLALNQRAPAITSMTFHPHHMVMAAAAEDSHLAVRHIRHCFFSRKNVFNINV
jgi:hypothetical protein